MTAPRIAFRWEISAGTLLTMVSGCFVAAGLYYAIIADVRELKVRQDLTGERLNETARLARDDHERIATIERDVAVIRAKVEYKRNDTFEPR